MVIIAAVLVTLAVLCCLQMSTAWLSRSYRPSHPAEWRPGRAPHWQP